MTIMATPRMRAAHDAHGHDDHGHDDHHAREPPAAGSRVAELITTLTAAGRRGAVVGGVCRGRLPASRCARLSLLPWINSGDLKSVLDAARRYADRGDAGRGQHRVVARASLFDRLHARRPASSALLRLSVAVHLRDADAGDGGQSGAAVLRLGRRGSGELSADRFLVPEAVGERRRHQGLRRQPRRRFRLCARHLRRLHDGRLDRLRDDLGAARPRSPARPSTSSAGMPMR